jgi:hypothetical protein
MHANPHLPVRMAENKLLRRKCRPCREEVTGGQITEELDNLSPSALIV